MAWYDAITNPIRGIGRILRGNVKEGLHDITDSASKLAPAMAFIPGVGPLAAAGIGAVGSLGEELTDDEAGVDFARPVMAGAGGFLGGKGIEAVGGLKGIGGFLGLGGEGAKAAGMGGLPNVTGVYGAGGAGAAGAGAGAAAGAAGAAGGMDPLMKAALLTQGASALSSMYGAHQMGRMQDKELERRREMSRRLSPYVSELLARYSR